MEAYWLLRQFRRRAFKESRVGWRAPRITRHLSRMGKALRQDSQLYVIGQP